MGEISKAHRLLLREHVKATGERVNATDVERELLPLIEMADQRDSLLEALESLFNMADIAIRSGDWTVDGARDPDMILVRADKALQRARGESNE